MSNLSPEVKLQRYYENYPDVVTLQQFCEMLGGIGDSTARKLMHEQAVEHFVIRCTYYIPKASVIEYVQSEHYANLDLRLKHHIPILEHRKTNKYKWRVSLK